MVIRNFMACRDRQIVIKFVIFIHLQVRIPTQAQMSYIYEKDKFRSSDALSTVNSKLFSDQILFSIDDKVNLAILFR